MLWIKRNLFLAIGGLITLLLLGGGGLFLYTRLSKNKQLEEQIEERAGTLRRLRTMTPSPSQTNINLAKAGLASIQTAIDQAKAQFTPVPHERLSGLAFKTLLDTTLADLRKQAQQASVRLPGEDYAFSFAWEKGVLNLPPDCFPALPAHLAEVSRICQSLFEARINALESISRPRVSSQAPNSDDYHNMTTRTNEATKMTLTPYQVNFLSFSPELARILTDFRSSKHGFVVTVLRVDAIVPETAPASRMPTIPGAEAATDRLRQPRATRGGPAPPRDELETVINERPLKVMLLIEVIKPAE